MSPRILESDPIRRVNLRRAEFMEALPAFPFADYRLAPRASPLRKTGMWDTCSQAVNQLER